MTLTPLEEIARKLDERKATIDEVVEEFLGTELLFPSSTDPKTRGVTPAVTHLDGVPHVVVATGEEGLDMVRDFAKYAIRLDGRQVIAGTIIGLGILVSTSYGGFALHPEVLDKARREHGIDRREPEHLGGAQ